MRSVSVGLVLAACLLASGCTLVDSLGPGPEYRGPGAAYESYLAGESDTIVVELDHVPGASWDPDTPAREQFVDELERITQKDVIVRERGELPEKGQDYAYSLSELYDLHDTYQDEGPGNGSETMHALFLDGKLDESTGGVAFDTRAFALFKGKIREDTCANDERVCRQDCPGGEPICQRALDPSVREWKVTRSVAIHEAGHLLGLVNSPLPMVEDHEMDDDPRPGTPAHENASHSANEDSVMFWRVANTVELDDYADGGEVPSTFDEDDIADARAVQSGG